MLAHHTSRMIPMLALSHDAYALSFSLSYALSLSLISCSDMRERDRSTLFTNSFTITFTTSFTTCRGMIHMVIPPDPRDIQRL